MHGRIQQALDGTLDVRELTAQEVAELRLAESDIAGVRRALPDEPLPDLAAAVLRRIADPEPATSSPHSRPARRRMPLGWLWEPRPVTIRPVWALAALAILAVGFLARPPRDPATPLAAESAGATLVLVHFQLEAPGASEVRLVGDFTGWQPIHALTRTESGTWSVFVPLTPGLHQYAFVVDGARWVLDPHAQAVEDGFGGANSRLAVFAPAPGVL